MLRSVERSSDMGPWSLCRFCLGCIIATRGYDFWEGQVLFLGWCAVKPNPDLFSDRGLAALATGDLLGGRAKKPPGHKKRYRDGVGSELVQ